MDHALTWQRISCKRRDDIYYLQTGQTQELCVISGRSDMTGQFGDPRVETIWGDPMTDRAVLKDVRHPRYEWDSQSGDREPCEHYEFGESR